jgi:membrane-associated phospholipid phosphatase
MSFVVRAPEGTLHRTSTTIALGCALWLFAGRASADTPSPLEWNEAWPRFRTEEAVVTAGLLANAAATFLYPPPQRSWEGGILFDDAVRGGLRLESGPARSRVARISDYIYYGLLAYPVLDTTVLTVGGRASGDVALQMTLINLESFAFTGVIALTAEKVGRARPMALECDKNPGYDGKCGDEAKLSSSFLSGHTTIAFAGAGLICVHHQHLPLYGGGLPDALVCATGLAAASTAGVFRVMSDNHYASDVLLGAGVGLLGGYVLPSLLHYGFGSGPAKAQSVLPEWRVRVGGVPIHAAMAPVVGPEAIGLTMVGDLPGP